MVRRRRNRPVHDDDRPRAWEGPNEVLWLVLYDVEDDRTRGRVFDACKDFGLAPIQYSAFAGTLPRPKAQELAERLRRELGSDPGTFLAVPVCEKDLARLETAGEPLGTRQRPFCYVV